MGHRYQFFYFCTYYCDCYDVVQLYSLWDRYFNGPMIRDQICNWLAFIHNAVSLVELGIVKHGGVWVRREYIWISPLSTKQDNMIISTVSIFDGRVNVEIKHKQSICISVQRVNLKRFHLEVVSRRSREFEEVFLLNFRKFKPKVEKSYTYQDKEKNKKNF